MRKPYRRFYSILLVLKRKRRKKKDIYLTGDFDGDALGAFRGKPVKEKGPCVLRAEGD